MLILVWDACPYPPILARPDDDTEQGRGLLLVDAVSAQWNWYPVTDKIGGKIVWALIEGEQEGSGHG